MGNHYWKEEKNKELITAWRTADRKQQFIIYNKLYTNVYYMTNSILQRYFTMNYNQDMIIKDCLNHLFLNLHNYKPPKSTFSYCGTIIKNYLLQNTTQRNTIKVLMIDYVDNYNSDYNEPIYTDNDVIDYKAVLKRLEERKKELTIIPDQYTNKSHKKLNKDMRERLVIFFEKFIEYVNKYENLDKKAISNYIEINSDLSNVNINHYFQLAFGVSVLLLNDNYFSEDEQKNRSIVQDDYCNREDFNNIYSNRNANKLKHLDKNQYNYM